jgi:triosephosphate isomerase
MTTLRRPLIAGNWKMNGLAASAAELAAIAAGAVALAKVDLLVCPPATLVMRFAALGAVPIGGQDCHAEPSGAFTGDIAAEMLADAGARAVILGHSERRALHRETDAQVRGKVEAAWRACLLAIVCVGETKAERLDGRTLTVVGTQLSGSIPDGATAANLVIAYEPVWAIGTGLTPTPADVGAVHAFIRERLAARFPDAAPGIRILYGGSVKPANAAELMAVENVDGALVGGASLKAEEFLAIARVYA